MTKSYQKFNDYLIEKLKNKKEAKAFLDAAIEAYQEDLDSKSLMLSLRRLAEAQGGVSELAEKTQLNRQNLYKILTGKTQPKLDTTFSIIQGLGYDIKLVPHSSNH